MIEMIIRDFRGLVEQKRIKSNSLDNLRFVDPRICFYSGVSDKLILNCNEQI